MNSYSNETVNSEAIIIYNTFILIPNNSQLLLTIYFSLKSADDYLTVAENRKGAHYEVKSLVTLIEHSVQPQLHCLSIAETNTRSNASLTLVAYQYYKIIVRSNNYRRQIRFYVPNTIYNTLRRSIINYSKTKNS